MLSRIADSLYWLNRYMERSDALVRCVRIHYILLLDKGIYENISWQPLLRNFANMPVEETEVIKTQNQASMHWLLTHPDNPNALKTIMGRARENARGVQDFITKEVWEQVNQMYHTVNGLSATANPEVTIRLLDDLTDFCNLYNGVTDTTMPRGTGWSFMNIGRYIERAIITLDMSIEYFNQGGFSLKEEKDILQWRPLLLSLSGYELHLKTYRSTQYSSNTLHQVLFNENFTRSVLYSLVRLEKYLSDISGHTVSHEGEALKKMMGRLVSKVKYTDLDYLTEENLEEYLKELRNDIRAYSHYLAQYFFSYA